MRRSCWSSRPRPAADLQAAGAAELRTLRPGHALLLAAAGPVTAVPLLLFGAGAKRVPLTTLGLLQYITPVIQFLIGVLYFNESLPPSRLAGFVLVWLALVVFTIDSLHNGQRVRQSARADAEPVTTG